MRKSELLKAAKELLSHGRNEGCPKHRHICGAVPQAVVELGGGEEGEAAEALRVAGKQILHDVHKWLGEAYSMDVWLGFLWTPNRDEEDEGLCAEWVVTNPPIPEVMAALPPGTSFMDGDGRDLIGQAHRHYLVDLLIKQYEGEEA
jgi:hypothetical protein